MNIQPIRQLLVVVGDYNQALIVRVNTEGVSMLTLQKGTYSFPVISIRVETDLKLNGAISTIKHIFDGQVPPLYLVDELGYVQFLDNSLFTKDLGRISDITSTLEVPDTYFESKKGRLYAISK